MVFFCLQKLEDDRERERQEQNKKNRAMQEKMDKEAKDAERRRKTAAHTEAVSNYDILLNEMIKDVNASWTDWKPRLQRDPQVRISGCPLSFPCLKPLLV